jgi:hypothetical protein
MTRSPRTFVRVAALATALFSGLTSIAAQREGLAADLAARRHGAGLFRAADGSLQADGACYRARFDAAGAGIWTGAADPRSHAPLTLRLHDAARSVALDVDPHAAGRRQGAAMVVYDHGDLVERYTLGASGFEQSFVLRQRPAGHGDLVLGVAVTGDHVAARTAAEHQAIEFRSPAGDAVRYGEAIVFERGGDPVEVATRYDGHGRIELIVPGAFLDAASYPVVVDPAVGPVLSPGGPYYNDSQPDVAFEESTEHYLVVWTRTWTSGATDLRGQLYDRDGAAVGTMVALTGNGQSRQPSIAPTSMWGPAGFVVAYERGDRVQLAHFRASDGAPLLAAIDIGQPGPGARDRRPAVSGRTAYFAGVQVAWDRTPTGANDPNQILTAHVHAINSQAQLVCDSEHVLDTATTGFVRNVRLAQNLLMQQGTGANVFWDVSRAVWERFYPSPSPGDFDVRTSLFRARRQDQFQLLNGPQLVIGASSIGDDESQPAIAVHTNAFYAYGNDATYLVAWNDQDDVQAHRYDLNGPVGSVIDVRSGSDHETEPAVAAGAAEFSVAYFEATPPNEFARNVRAARVLLDGTKAIDDRAIDVLNGPFQDRLRAASQPLPVANGGARRNTAMFAWRGATGTGSGLNKVRLRRFEPVVASSSPFGTACPGPLGELPAIGTAGGDPIAGNTDFRFTLTDSPPTTIAALVISDQLTTTAIPGAPGCFLYAGAPVLDVLPVVVDPAGDAVAFVPIPISLPGSAQLAFQWAVWTPGWNAFGWIVSDDLDISWSHF